MEIGEIKIPVKRLNSTDEFLRKTEKEKIGHEGIHTSVYFEKRGKNLVATMTKFVGFIIQKLQLHAGTKTIQ